jgi:hypothetical protein
MCGGPRTPWAPVAYPGEPTAQPETRPINSRSITSRCGQLHSKRRLVMLAADELAGLQVFGRGPAMAADRNLACELASALACLRRSPALPFSCRHLISWVSGASGPAPGPSLYAARRQRLHVLDRQRPQDVVQLPLYDLPQPSGRSVDVRLHLIQHPVAVVVIPGHSQREE